MSYPESEQWRSGGVCSKCRRKNYCHKSCRASKGRLNAVIGSAVMETFAGVPIDTIKEHIRTGYGTVPDSENTKGDK